VTGGQCQRDNYLLIWRLTIARPFLAILTNMDFMAQFTLKVRALRVVGQDDCSRAIRIAHPFALLFGEEFVAEKCLHKSPLSKCYPAVSMETYASFVGDQKRALVSRCNAPARCLVRSHTTETLFHSLPDHLRHVSVLGVAGQHLFQFRPRQRRTSDWFMLHSIFWRYGAAL
jgi:hypothetical protein